MARANLNLTTLAGTGYFLSIQKDNIHSVHIEIGKLGRQWICNFTLSMFASLLQVFVSIADRLIGAVVRDGGKAKVMMDSPGSLFCIRGRTN
jgi:hypothetical protein